jgi:hypothetical protein
MLSALLQVDVVFYRKDAKYAKFCKMKNKLIAFLRRFTSDRLEGGRNRDLSPCSPNRKPVRSNRLWIVLTFSFFLVKQKEQEKNLSLKNNFCKNHFFAFTILFCVFLHRKKIKIIMNVLHQKPNSTKVNISQYCIYTIVTINFKIDNYERFIQRYWQWNNIK